MCSYIWIAAEEFQLQAFIWFVCFQILRTLWHSNNVVYASVNLEDIIQSISPS